MSTRTVITILALVATATIDAAEPTSIRWDFGAEETSKLQSVGGVERDVPGPRPPDYPDFDANNTAVRLDGRGAHLLFEDPGPDSFFDFNQGDAITLEAWVQVDEIGSGENRYIIGKGRTGDPRFAPDNQNWSLRLRESNGKAAVNFLFASAIDPGGKSDAHWHRWNANGGFAPGKGWHHVAVAYRFGEPGSIRGWLDGKLVEGTWDMGGETEKPPVVDNDAIWIGSSRGGAPANSLKGAIDSVVVHRMYLGDEVLKNRYKRVGSDEVAKPAKEVSPELGQLEPGQILFTFSEGMPSHDRWLNEGETFPPEMTRFVAGVALLDRLPQRFDAWGIRDDWKSPVLVRMASDVTLPPGKHRLLVRTRGLSRLWFDGQIVARTKPVTGARGGEDLMVPVATPPVVGMRVAEHEQKEAIGEITVEQEGPYRVVFETLVGGKAFRADPGETCVAVQTAEGEPFRLLPLEASLDVTDAAIVPALAKQEAALLRLDDQTRRAAAESRREYWQRRHDVARSHLNGNSATHDIDAFLQAKIDAALGNGFRDRADIVPPQRIDDTTFLRRVYLDTVGVPPSEAAIRAFLSDSSADKRAKTIDRLLADDAWADHWMGYWQDVLAENPTLINASLNTTGPFRWYVYDSLRDNKPFDRFVTELLLLRGSQHEGGSAGFAIAADNDAPLAAKGQIVASAFLGIELQCARCHDSPYHTTTQRDLYSLAAMFDRKPIVVPKTSRVPAAFFETEKARAALIKVTLQPDEPVEPKWPFGEITGSVDDDFLASLQENKNDSRERLAALVTSPKNKRFAQVLVNRVWRRLMGAGIVEPPHDWEASGPSHPELLLWLADEFVSHDFDVKHIARLVLNSQAYQRQAIGKNAQARPSERFFAAPDLRRMTAEQLIDALHTSAGRPMDVEEMTFDPDARRLASNRLTLGVPRRAWQLAYLANERDRPSLNLPKARLLADIMIAFGWSGARQSPRTDRETSPNVLQPGVLANSPAAVNLTRVAIGSELAQLAIDAPSPESLVESLFLRYLSRLPSANEQATMVDALAPGFGDRVLPADKIVPPPPEEPLPKVTWSNHLRPEATTVAHELERRAKAGPPADPRLDPVWRESLEDAVWSLVNLREFVWIP